MRNDSEHMLTNINNYLGGLYSYYEYNTSWILSALKLLVIFSFQTCFGISKYHSPYPLGQNSNEKNNPFFKKQADAML